jgi:hypothetical protein
MPLLADRIEALGTENAFKLGVDIQRVLDRGIDVVKLNLGEPDFDSHRTSTALGLSRSWPGIRTTPTRRGSIPYDRRSLAT